MIGFATSAAVAADSLKINWAELPPLPPAPGHAKQPGVASPFVGTHDGVLLVAGGANFPDLLPWQGGKKVWWDTVFALEEGAAQWRVAGKLPGPMGYGLSFSTPGGVLCVGGSDPTQCLASVFLLRWNRANKQTEIVPYPSLPETLAFAGGGIVQGKLYVVGGQAEASSAASTKRGYVLDLKDGVKGRWQKLPDLPGEARSLPISFSVGSGPKPGVYLFGGRDQKPGEAPKLFKDGFRFDPASGRWEKLNDMAGPLMAGTAVEYRHGQAIVLGGDTGEIFLVKEKLTAEMRHAEKTAPQDVPALKAREKDLLENHKGFSRKGYVYDSASDTWSETNQLPEWTPVTTTATWWGEQLVLPSGEIRPGIRSPKVWVGQLADGFTSASWPRRP